MRRNVEESHQRASKLLLEADIKHRNFEHAQKYFKSADLLTNLFRAMSSIESNSRIGWNYILPHTMLDYLSRGQIEGKRILQVGASTGVYTRFLNDFCGAKAVALDLAFHPIKDAVERGQNRGVVADAVPARIKKRQIPLPNGVLVKPERRFHLPFREGSLDYIISDHFLFSNFHLGIGGFEHADGSMVKSQSVLPEYNRVLKTGGRIIVHGAHPEELPELKRYQQGKKLFGFVVEKVFDADFAPRVSNITTGERWIPQKGPKYFCLRKITPL